MGQSSLDSNDLVLTLLIEELLFAPQSRGGRCSGRHCYANARSVATAPLIHERVEVEHVPVGRFLNQTRLMKMTM
jgi:hypothetical protein